MKGTPSGAALSGAGKRPVILVVEDDAAVSAVMLALLKKIECDAVVMSDPREALRRVGSGELKPDLMITDYAMPHMSGVELIRRCRVIQPGLRTVLCTGDFEAPAVGKEGGAPDEFLEKPFGARALTELVGRLLGTKGPSP
jgi:CheY-like chemotaxis protein